MATARWNVARRLGVLVLGLAILFAMAAKTTALVRLHRVGQALAAARRWGERAPDDIEARLRIAWLLYQVHHDDEEVRSFVASGLRSHPNDPRFEVLRGYGSVLTGD